ncbi:hypothetical protein COCVIDRAFT_48803, partial [Bipolaris victoriae FI3]
AAISGDITTLDSLMGFGFSVDTRADDQSTALHCAARSGQARTVQYLLDKGASCNTFNDKRRQPLHEAILSGDSDTLKALIQYTPEGKHPYINKDTMPYLALTKNMEVFDLAIHVAARYGRTEIIEQMLHLGNLNLQCRDREDYTPLHYAAFNGHWKAVQLLLEY